MAWDRSADRRAVPGDAEVLAAVALGGTAGGCARYGVGLAWPAAAGGVPWSTLAINTSGCLLIGVLMAVVAARPVHRLARPFLGVGLLGGYTTFSTYTVDARVLLAAGRPAAALGYLAGTAAAALLAVHVGTVVTRAIMGRRPPAAGRAGTR